MKTGSWNVYLFLMPVQKLIMKIDGFSVMHSSENIHFILLCNKLLQSVLKNHACLLANSFVN